MFILSLAHGGRCFGGLTNWPRSAGIFCLQPWSSQTLGYHRGCEGKKQSLNYCNSVIPLAVLVLKKTYFWPRLAAFRILLPRPGNEPGPSQCKHRVLTTGPPGSFHGAENLNSKSANCKTSSIRSVGTNFSLYVKCLT